MKYILTSVTVILFFLAAVTSLSAQNKNSVRGDLEALRALYNATDGDKWKNNSGWLNGNPSNKWYGVEVNRQGRVIRLDLYKNNLNGELPKSIGNLSKLKFFSVKRNPIYSKIPASIGNWENAEIVMFSSGSDHNLPNENTYNDHQGKTPSSKAAKYIGTIPDVFDKMPNLRILQIAWQENLEGQPYPSSLYSHPSLEILELQGTQLTGTLKDAFNLPEMRRFIIGDNHLEGVLPHSLGSMTKVINIRLGHSDWFVRNTSNVKRFTGTIPSTFSNFSRVRYFFLSNQEFSGEIPGYIVKNWKGLREIGLGKNNFTGEIPKEFGDFNLTVFMLDNNKFSGTIHPNLVSGMQNVILFNIRGNNLSGELPNGQMVDGEWKGWRTKTRLRTLTIDSNNFTGPLPDMPEYVGDMSLATLHRNNFSGGIPDTWKELFTPALRDKNPKRTFNNLQLRGNQLQGILPAWFTSENFDGRGIDLKGNRWSRRDILENGVNVSVGEDHDAPQLPFGQQQQFKRPIGSSISLDYSHKVHSSDNVRWSKLNGSTGKWQRDERFNGTALLEIDEIQQSDYGSYRMELINTRTSMPGALYSEPIIIKKGSYEDPGSSNLLGNGNDNEGSGNEENGSAGDDGAGVANGGKTETFPAAPTLYGPADNSDNVSLKPEFAWSDIGAEYYILHVSRQDPGGIIDVVVSDTTFSPDERFDDNLAHHWMVRGVKEGVVGEWSETKRFETEEKGLPDVPDIKFPGHYNQNVHRLTKFAWEDTGADSYMIRLMKKKTSEVLFSEAISDTIYDYYKALSDNTEYIWQVKGVTDKNHGAWGPVWEFSTGFYDIQPPTLLSPEQGTIKNNLVPVLDWEDMDADRYEVIISRNTSEKQKSNSSELITVIFDDTSESTYTPAFSLEPEIQYYWQVRAVKDGEEGIWSDLWEFSLTNSLSHKSLSIQPKEQQSAKEQQPVVTSINQNYPNPFNPTTQIEFALSEAQKVSLKVYDMAGRQVALLVDNVLEAGHHSATFDASNLSSGIYIYRFISDTHQFSRKMTLIK